MAAMATSKTQLRLTVSDSTSRYLQQNSRTCFTLNSERGAVIVGRAPDADVRLQSPSVSRQHASIEHDGSNWRIRDLHSRAGTQVNQANVPEGDFQILQTDDQVKLGPIVLVVHEVSETDAISDLLLRAGGSSDDCSIVAKDLPGFVKAIPEAELSGLAQHRLAVLLHSAASLNGASDVAALAKEITQSAAVGTESPRAILIGTAKGNEWVVLGQYPVENAGDSEIAISRSLVLLAKRGRVAQLQSDGSGDSFEARSIVSLNIQSAICAPVLVDEFVEAVLYLDTRGTENPIKIDAAAFCVGLAQLGGMALANLRRAELARQEKELRDDLNAARTAQQQMIPESSGEVGAVRYALATVPGTIVAGDLFDIILLDESCTMVLLGDVMGKGAAAGLMMATVQTYFRTRANPHSDLSQLLAEANLYFRERFKGGFVTLWIGMFFVSTHRLAYVDAGHGHWCVFHQDVGPKPVESQGGPPIGALPDATYTSGELVIQPNDRIIIFSDGLVEQHDDQGNIFEESDVLKCLSSSRSSVEDVQLLIDTHTAFRGSVPLSDDLTVASIEWIGR